MRRTLVLLAIAIAVLVIPQPADRQLFDRESVQSPIAATNNGLLPAAAGGAGASSQSVQFMSRTLASRVLNIANSYAATTKHNGTLSLEQYLLSGWTLYNVTMNLTNITASPEREVVGVTYQKDDFAITKAGPSSYLDQLAQSFYNQPHNGSLLNYSIRYKTSAEVNDPVTFGYAFTTIRSDYTNSASNLTQQVNLPYIPGLNPQWRSFSGRDAKLTRNTLYWATIDGTNLKDNGSYAVIPWASEGSPGLFSTTYHLGIWWNQTYEALMNYTYVPWDKTTSTPLIFSAPSIISVRANSTNLISATKWSFSRSTNDITLVRFDSNQSASVYYDLTLWYRRSVTSSTSWRADVSGGTVNWNASVSLSYPSLSGLVSRFVNISTASDWTAVALYNGTSSTDYDNFQIYPGVVSCSLTTNGTWTLKCTAFNYLTLITTKESGSGNLLPRMASVLDSVDVESSIQDQLGNPANSGSTNLTVWFSGSRIWAPSLVPVVAGKSTYTWDVSSTPTHNGKHIMEVFWSNGTEAGYLSKDFVIYYPTSLTADEYTIDALTDDDFFVRVNYDDVFTPMGLNSTYAAVTYSFNVIVNASMSYNPGDGAWNATVYTTSMSYGTYNLTVYAEGYALQNRSITITVNLVHETQSLSASWDPGNTLDWTQTVVLSITYRDIYGIPITDATRKDVYINGTLYGLSGTNGTYWIQINSTFGLGHHLVSANISKEGYRPRTLGGITFDTNEALTGLTVSWQPLNTTITYAQLLNLTVDYTHDGSDVPPSPIVSVTIDGHNYNLTYSAGAWIVSIPGKDIGLGPHNATIEASLYGYQYQTQLTSGLSVTVASNTLISVAASTRIDGYSTIVLYNDGWVNISVRIQDTESNPVTTGTVNLNISSRTYFFTLQPSDNFTLIVQMRDLGVGFHSGTIHVYAYGYQEKTVPLSLEVEPVPTHIEVTEGQIPSIMYLNQTCIFVLEYVNDHNDTAVDGAFVAYSNWSNVVTVSQISRGTFRVTIDSFMLSLTSHLFNVTFGHANFTSAGNRTFITVRPVFTHLTPGQISFSQYENETVTIWANYTDSDHRQAIHWASVNATIEGIVYPMAHIGQGIYSVSFRITLPPGALPYAISIVAAATGCSSNMTSSDLNVEEKQDVYLSLDFLGSPVEGNSITIRALLRYNGSDSPVVNALVEFEVAAVYGNGSRQTFMEAYLTSNSGEASWSFNIPIGSLSAVDHLEVVATYHGATSIWPASRTLEIKVTLGMIALLVIFLTSTEGLVVMACIFGAVVAAAYQEKKRKPRKLALRRSLQHQLQDFNDLGTLRHFMAVYLNRGTCVFYHPFGESRIQADLISGFISAITSVYGEIKGNGVQGTLEEIHYHGLRLNSYSGKYVIGMLILEGDLTPLLKDRLQYFVGRFEDQYEDDLKDWNGQTECFDPEWIVSNIIAAFNFNWVLPHKLSPQKKMTGGARKILRIIGARLDEKGEFLIGDVLAPVAKAISRTEPEVLDYLLRMEERGLITPISISTVLQRQGMALVDKEVCAAGEAPVLPGEVEVVTPKTEEEEQLEPEIRAETVPKYARGMEARAPIEKPSPEEIQPEAASGAPPEHVELKPEEQFLAEVEKLLISERERKQRAAQMKEKKRKDEAESFIDDVERLLASDKDKEED